ncbi:MAG: PEP-CTERM sorting domain-containing protein [Chloroflexi bacterium]|nr:PEP-CTERM sorting domain-containing protein [Chloroflexota bacterium]
MRRRYSKITGLLVAVVLSLAGSNAVAQITMRFPVTRDVGIWAEGTEQMVSSGKQGYLRPLKLFENAVIMDFDTDAMDAFLQANTGPATWTFNIFNSDNTIALPAASGDIEVVTVESTNDWVAGNGNGADQFNWTEGTPSATYFYAQTVYETDSFGPDFPQVVTATSLEWNDPDSGRYTFTSAFPDDLSTYGIPGAQTDWQKDPTPEFTNSARFLNADIAAAGQNNDNIGGAPISTVIDDDIINALITDVNNRGLRFGPLANAQASNWTIWGQRVEQQRNRPDLVPYLEVTIEIDAGPGDFDEDGSVDGNDFLVWQRGGSPNGATAGDLNEWETNYGAAASTAAVASVPEPTSGLLFLMGVSGLLGRRRR